MNEEEERIYKVSRDIIDIRVINAYQRYALEGIIHPLTCQVDSDHLPLLGYIDKDENVHLYCLGGCTDYIIGLSTYQRLFDIVFMLDKKRPSMIR